MEQEKQAQQRCWCELWIVATMCVKRDAIIMLTLCRVHTVCNRYVSVAGWWDSAASYLTPCLTKAFGRARWTRVMHAVQRYHCWLQVRWGLSNDQWCPENTIGFLRGSICNTFFANVWQFHYPLDYLSAGSNLFASSAHPQPIFLREV